MTARHPALITLGGFLTALAVIALGLAVGDDTVERAQLAARWTARVGFPIFVLTYLASSLYRLRPNERTRALLKERRWWGLSFAVAHTVHLIALIAYLQISGDTRPASVIVGGGIGYVLLYAMVLTSNHRSQRALGKNWKRLHTLGIHYIWFIFAFSYSGRLFDPERWLTGAVFTPVALAALGVRLWARFRPAGVTSTA
jgi:DMSO/TMAO reductase YedYZ heme-binding membrane subunit